MKSFTPESFDVGRAWDMACDLLEKIGMYVVNPTVLEKAKTECHVVGDYVRIPRATAQRYADEIRTIHGRLAPSPTADTTLLGNSSVSFHHLDPLTGKRVPMDTNTLIRYTRLIGALTDEGVMHGCVAGFPMDAPPRMQTIISSYVNCCHLRDGYAIGLGPDSDVLEVLIEMSTVMGRTYGLCLEAISPMRLTGGSVDTATAHAGTGISVNVDPMPVMGITAPLDWYGGWGQSMAECVGGYALMRLVGHERVGAPTFRLFMPNMASGLIYLASPKAHVLLALRRKVKAFFGLSDTHCELMLVTARLPDQQAAAEKVAGLMTARQLGYGFVEGAGNLSVDEVFSPQQLIIDCEISKYVHAQACTYDPPEEDCVTMVERGMKAGLFMGEDLTVERHLDFGWRPEVFDLALGDASARPGIMERSARIAEEKEKSYEFELGGERRRDLDRLMERAWAKLGA